MHWWQTGVIYQIYPRSFQDTNGDGVGDLAGIKRRLPYLAELGVDAIWLSPIYPSPMADFGYDVADYTDIDPVFGTLAEFDDLLTGVHAHGLRLILDFVPNHTSDRHPWFLESRSSRSNKKRDWYIWRDPSPGRGPPNNWLAEFGGSGWEYDSVTDQYYCHTFLPTQPDLNWRNRSVRSAMYDVMRFWLQRGVDGFRVDVVWHLIKDEAFRDNPANMHFATGAPPHHALVPLYTADRPEVHGIIREMRGVVEEFSDRVLIGEIYLPTERLVAYYGRDLDGLHYPFNFALLKAPWEARTIAQLIDEYEAALPAGGWPNWVLGNHDRPRIATRVGSLQAPVAAVLLLTLRGTPTIYYGDELGMEQMVLRPDQVRDPFEKKVPGHSLGRDGCRTPMQWDAAQFAGFSTVEPWLPVEPLHQRRNVANLRLEAASIYNVYRALIALRRRSQALRAGIYRPVMADGNLLLFVRTFAAERILVALNMGDQPIAATFHGGVLTGRMLLSSLGDRADELVTENINLRGNEGVVIELAAEAVLPA